MHNIRLYIHILPNIITVTKSMRGGWAGYVVRNWIGGMDTELWRGDSKTEDLLESLGNDGRIILMWISRKQGLTPGRDKW